MELSPITFKEKGKRLDKKISEILSTDGRLSSRILKQEQGQIGNLYTAQLNQNIEILQKLFVAKVAKIYALDQSGESKTELRISL